ncbi:MULTISPECIES: type I secretion system permease/ATPase [Thioalkalivibrio]|uniref:type I secretion system permease/ATPase n=1 Tax=Thioalkalivibrio TaxID=106633 RepID=UPI00035F26A8|nr:MULTISPECIES: type I secretion system permease/ATPase [Thioalkalivibrio]OOC50267.1 type I secretion system permease/ATPase [Thioalkalivibrio versutus]
MDSPGKAAPDPHDENGALDTGLTALAMLAQYHGVPANPAQLRHEFAPDGQPFDFDRILHGARHLGLKAKRVRTKLARLEHTPLPAIAQATDGRFFVLARVGEQGVLVQHPGRGQAERMSWEALEELWSGELVLLTSRALLRAELGKFDFTWFVPALVKHRKLLGEVMLASFFLQIFALVTPLFFQVVMDKVLVHRSLTTLDVLAIGLLAVMVFEVVLSGLRSYILAHTASRIDVELGASLFRHLIHLPMGYFESRRVGDSVARVRELENIREFLTGNALTLVLDLLFSVVFIAVMLLYSGWLTLIVIASLPLYVLISVLITPPLRARLHEKFNRGAENQAFLVESINGIDTLKTMAVEPQTTKKWDEQLAGYVSAGLHTTRLSTIARELISLVGKLVTVGTLWLGARLVIEGDLTVGQLIAFNMLAARVAQPIMRLANMWTDFQQVGISMQRLGDILNAPTESSFANRSNLPRLEGRIEFDQVHFRYRPDGPEVLRGLSLEIPPGQVLGVVGRSGSGKSTLAKLMARMYVPERGRVLVDGTDLAVAEISSLRRQIGVVQQENMLFNRSIRENIALASPGASLEQVMTAARQAGAHDFILETPEGYDTTVGEHGSSLSGGQRQRIAIARALMNDPRILIFDEATSALDYESERLIQQNMQHIARGRTVIIIAHRLSAVRRSDRIIAMEHGQIIESGSHDELAGREGGFYAGLLRMQRE